MVAPFSLDEPKYDQSTYLGRLQSSIEALDPRMLFVSESEALAAQSLLDDFKTNSAKGATDEQLWQARNICDAVIHPGTGKVIHPLGRMAGFVPVNVPLVFGMLNSPGMAGTIFWQWANQSYNSALNYCNRSGTDISQQEMFTSYGIAVGTSLGIAISVRTLGSRGSGVIRKLANIPFVTPYLSVATAGAANVYFTRRPELLNGVDVVDEDGKVLGVSKKASQQSVAKTILSRSVGLPIPVLILPHLAMKLVPKGISPRALMFTELTVVTLSLFIALPAAIAVFPQRLSLDVSSLEAEFQGLVDKEGQPIKTVYCNKGL